MEFSICGRNVVITDDELYSHKLHTVFKDRARNASRKFVEKYRAYQGWSTFVASAPKDGYQIIADEAEFAAEILVKEGKYAVTGDALLAKYGDTVFEPWNQVVNDLAELLEQVHESEKEAELARELRKNSRGRVIGGGFGVSGAVKGMAFAGAANLVTGSVHSIANAIGNAKTRNEIARQEAKLYQNEDFVRYLRDQIYNGVLTLGGCVAAEHGVDAEIVQPRNPEFTASLMKNYGLVPENDRLEVLFHALENNVYEIQVYEHLLKEFDHSEEAAQIGRLFGLGVEIDRICVDVLTKLVPSESDLSARSMEENLTLLDVYRRKKERLGYERKIPAEERIELAIIPALLPQQWEACECGEISTVLAEIAEKKKAYGITSVSAAEKRLSDRLTAAMTVNGTLYPSLEVAEQAREIRKEAAQLVSDCDVSSEENVTKVRARLLSWGEQITPNCVMDYTQKIDHAFRDLCTFRGETFETLKEKHAVEADYAFLFNTYLSHQQSLTVQKIISICAEADVKPGLHKASKRLFKDYCAELMEKAKQEEHDREVQRYRNIAQSKLAELKLNDYSRKNYHRLKEAASELEKLNVGCEDEALPQIKAAIETCEKLYERENALQRLIEEDIDKGTAAFLTKSIIKTLLLYLVVLIAAGYLFSGWLQFLVQIGAIGAVFSESGKHIRESHSSKGLISQHREELEEIRKKINAGKVEESGE